MKPSLFWKITHWLRGGNIGSVQRSIRETHRAYLDAHKKSKMSCEYMETLELDDLLDIQSKHSEGTPIYLRVQFELQRRFNQKRRQSHTFTYFRKIAPFFSLSDHPSPNPRSPIPHSGSMNRVPFYTRSDLLLQK
jgi:hypothetical protein